MKDVMFNKVCLAHMEWVFSEEINPSNADVPDTFEIEEYLSMDNRNNTNFFWLVFSLTITILFVILSIIHK